MILFIFARSFFNRGVLRYCSTFPGVALRYDNEGFGTLRHETMDRRLPETQGVCIGLASTSPEVDAIQGTPTDSCRKSIVLWQVYQMSIEFFYSQVRWNRRSVSVTTPVTLKCSYRRIADHCSTIIIVEVPSYPSTPPTPKQYGLTASIFFGSTILRRIVLSTRLNSGTMHR